MSHNDYIFDKSGGRFRFLRRFDDMYRNCDDPHGQSNELERLDYQLAAAIVARLIAQGTRPHILDVGCGLGYFTGYMKRLFPAAAVSGCDISETALEKARRNAGQCDFFSFDLKAQSAAAPRAYDIVVALQVLYYFLEEEVPGVLQNLKRLTKTDGFVLVGYHLPDDMSFGRYLRSLEDARRLFQPHGFVFRFTLDTVNDLDRAYAGGFVGRNIYFLAQRI